MVVFLGAACLLFCVCWVGRFVFGFFGFGVFVFDFACFSVSFVLVFVMV